MGYSIFEKVEARRHNGPTVYYATNGRHREMSFDKLSQDIGFDFFEQLCDIATRHSTPMWVRIVASDGEQIASIFNDGARRAVR